jgi:hypothetical protein
VAFLNGGGEKVGCVNAGQGGAGRGVRWGFGLLELSLPVKNGFLGLLVVELEGGTWSPAGGGSRHGGAEMKEGTGRPEPDSEEGENRNECIRGHVTWDETALMGKRYSWSGRRSLAGRLRKSS